MTESYARFVTCLVSFVSSGLIMNSVDNLPGSGGYSASHIEANHSATASALPSRPGAHTTCRESGSPPSSDRPTGTDTAGAPR